MNEVITVSNLCRDYKSTKGFLKKKKYTVQALKGISFSVKKGEVFAILGPNGAGKTTTIKILTTLLAPTSGEAKVLGYNPFGEEKQLRPKINFIYGGERNLYWRISARENLEYFSDLYKVENSIKKKRIPELLELVGLTDRADEKVETFSKGMKQRLQIARGLVNDPEILFLDEPTIGLDPVGARDLRNIIKKLSALGKTVIITTHYMFEADELSDRIAIIKDGKLVALDTPTNLKREINNTTVVEVKVKSVLEEEINALDKLEHTITTTVSKADDYHLISVNSTDFTETIKQIINIFDKTKIISISSRESTLEDVYIKYIGE
ncbi:ATP-binding cassette domain-containing protein [Bacillus aquiflavi]|uniref:ATP-binding cassette domain-containing protein n=1 Tax=Bacillus aquiflavi TaxID=2672567 RepID=A0A6B3VYU4_9BACI|nr:ATP-binding cassette domain-containing protein [Bacillus aquiflavi]MBA4536388.1 ATP-binding cassette domain-containing protein [Bacillus aquiflavi]NEY80756.1 ATP-binding cassette domain-containing protein [Bacillus aquiflavi]UAC48081.1 ATP-binding cassette domain-containing protein [Bacillus aquiflavi]